MTWRCIKDDPPPMDGTHFLARRRYAYAPSIVVVMFFSEGGKLLVAWDHDEEFVPEDWHPIPA